MVVEVDAVVVKVRDVFEAVNVVVREVVIARVYLDQLHY
jgi:hypothetical protein